MITNNLFRAIADFCTNVLFAPYDAFRSLDGWWNSNIVNAILIGTAFILMFYWLGKLQKFRNTANE